MLSAFSELVKFVLYPSTFHDLSSFKYVFILDGFNDIKAFILKDLKSIHKFILGLRIWSEIWKLLSKSIKAIDKLVKFFLFGIISCQMINKSILHFFNSGLKHILLLSSLLKHLSCSINVLLLHRLRLLKELLFQFLIKTYLRS